MLSQWSTWTWVSEQWHSDSLVDLRRLILVRISLMKDYTPGICYRVLRLGWLFRLIRCLLVRFSSIVSLRYVLSGWSYQKYVISVRGCNKDMIWSTEKSVIHMALISYFHEECYLFHYEADSYSTNLWCCDLKINVNRYFILLGNFWNKFRFPKLK